LLRFTGKCYHLLGNVELVHIFQAEQVTVNDSKKNGDC